MDARGGSSSPSSSSSSMFANPYLYLYAFGSFSNGLFISLRGPILPELASRIGCESTALGTYLGLAGVSGGISSVPTGMMLDRFDPHTVRKNTGKRAGGENPFFTLRGGSCFVFVFFSFYSFFEVVSFPSTASHDDATPRCSSRGSSSAPCPSAP